MKKIIVKFIVLTLVISTLVIQIPTISHAGFLDDVFQDAFDFLDTPSNQVVANSIDGGKVSNIGMYIYNILMTVGIIIAMIVIIVLGIQMMTGSIEQKAKVKEMLIPFVIGCVVIFGSLTIWRFIANFASTIG